MYRSIGVRHIRCQNGGCGGSDFGPAPEWAAKGAEPGIYLDSKKYMRDTLKLFDGIRAREGFDIDLVHDVHAALAGGALLCVGIGIPISNYVRMAGGLKKQIADNRLETPRQVYTVLLGEKGVAQQLGEDDTGSVSPVVPWEKVYGAWRTEDAIYLYVLNNRALLLPEGGVPETQDAIWEFLKTHMAQDSLHWKTK